MKKSIMFFLKNWLFTTDIKSPYTEIKPGYRTTYRPEQTTSFNEWARNIHQLNKK